MIGYWPVSDLKAFEHRCGKMPKTNLEKPVPRQHHVDQLA